MYHENRCIWKHGVNEGCLLIRWLKLYCLNWRPWGFLPCATLMTPKPKNEKNEKKKIFEKLKTDTVYYLYLLMVLTARLLTIDCVSGLINALVGFPICLRVHVTCCLLG